MFLRHMAHGGLLDAHRQESNLVKARSILLLLSAHCRGMSYCVRFVTDGSRAAALTCRPLRKQSTDKVRKSPRQSHVPHHVGDLCSTGAKISSVEGDHMLDSTPHSKTADKLAALCMSSPGYTPSPVPLRRRLQQQQPGLQEALDQANHNANANDNVICIG